MYLSSMKNFRNILLGNYESQRTTYSVAIEEFCEQEDDIFDYHLWFNVKCIHFLGRKFEI